MAGNKGLNGLNLSVNINKDAFKIIDVTAPEDMNFLKTFGAAVHDKSDDGSKALVALAYVGKSSGPKTSDYNGPIMVVELEVLNAAAGDYNFDIEVEKYTKNETGNLEDYEDVPYNSPAPGTIKIENPATDITVGDATVNMIYGNNYQIPINAVTENGGTTTTEKNLSFNVTQGSDIIDVSSEGLVTANKNKNGEAKVTVNAYGFTKEITINVSNPIKEIKLSKQDVTLEIKKMQGGSETKGSELITAELIAENPDGPISDDQTISWESNKGDVASVSGGTISAVGGGLQL